MRTQNALEDPSAGLVIEGLLILGWIALALFVESGPGAGEHVVLAVYGAALGLVWVFRLALLFIALPIRHLIGKPPPLRRHFSLLGLGLFPCAVILILGVFQYGAGMRARLWLSDEPLRAYAEDHIRFGYIDVDALDRYHEQSVGMFRIRDVAVHREQVWLTTHREGVRDCGLLYAEQGIHPAQLQRTDYWHLWGPWYQFERRPRR